MTFTIAESSAGASFAEIVRKGLRYGQANQNFARNRRKGRIYQLAFVDIQRRVFLPHGSKKDGFAEEQPIFISANEDNANNASLLILADGAMPDTETLKQYERILNIFDGNDETALNNARAYWKQIKALDGELHYWQQNDRGVFEQKA